ncbi:17607_t:CDS:2 [Funneliformis geosporum]|nr:17607_t:CDS:2 [Funneliformis geosporum]
MVEKELKKSSDSIFSELIYASQTFIRKVKEPYSVSLRDVKRVIKLANFFYDSLEKSSGFGRRFPSGSPTIRIRSYVLALGLCYHSRLYEHELRKKYCYEMGQIFQTHDIKVGEEIFIKIIREEQEYYFSRMRCPPNVAKIEVLLENILVLIVCILTKIPVFVIGETGLSKSLAVRLISSNLRGPESSDDYFKTLPKVHIVSYLCSSSSTSDGIINVFEKANKYQETNTDQYPIISVVLLNNVGYAEINRSNPLKVLHSMLEPENEPNVSFIGMSNWRLDINLDSTLPIWLMQPTISWVPRLLNLIK